MENSIFQSKGLEWSESHCGLRHYPKTAVNLELLINVPCEESETKWTVVASGSNNSPAEGEEGSE